MRTNFILKQIIDYLFYMLGIATFITVITSIVSLFTMNTNYLLYNLLSENIDDKWVIPISILNFLVTIFFFLGVGYLREVAKCFLKKKWYHENIARHFLFSGRYLTLTGILGFASNLIYTFNAKEHFRTADLSLRYGYLILFMLITGLCFIMISQILKETIDAKQENDLTI